jgi:hypothetical protein
MMLASPDPRENLMSNDGNKRNACSNDCLADETTVTNNSTHDVTSEVGELTCSPWRTVCYIGRSFHFHGELTLHDEQEITVEEGTRPQLLRELMTGGAYTARDPAS